MHRAGFTLLELIIVICILGLLVGGTMVGFELLRGAGLRSVMGELAKYEAATVTFREKYSGFPGDMNNAADTWPSAGGDGRNADCQNTVSYTTATCSGNGNGLIMTSAVNLDETFRAWQHLRNAELIDGTFVGSVGTGGTSLTQGELLTKVVPHSSFQQIGYQFYTASKSELGWTAGPDYTVPILAIRAGGTAPATTGAPILPIRIGANALSPLDLYTIDSKVDDGKPGIGKVFAVNTGSVSCLSGTNAGTATYTASNKNVGCYFHYSLTQ